MTAVDSKSGHRRRSPRRRNEHAAPSSLLGRQCLAHLLGREHEALLRRPQVAARRPDDPPDEEIENTRKPTLSRSSASSTAIGRGHGARDEDELGLSERDGVAVLELGPLGGRAVHLDAVRRARGRRSSTTFLAAAARHGGARRSRSVSRMSHPGGPAEHRYVRLATRARRTAPRARRSPGRPRRSHRAAGSVGR